MEHPFAHYREADRFFEVTLYGSVPPSQSSSARESKSHFDRKTKAPAPGSNPKAGKVTGRDGSPQNRKCTQPKNVFLATFRPFPLSPSTAEQVQRFAAPFGRNRDQTSFEIPLLVMAGLVLAIHALARSKGVDARHKAGHDELGRGFCRDHAMSKRSRFITLAHAAMKSFTNFSFASSEA